MDWYHPDLGLVAASAAFILDGVQHPAGKLREPGWAVAHGFLPVRQGPRPDDRYNLVSEQAVTVADGIAVVEWASTPRSLDQIKQVRLAELAAWRYRVEVGGCLHAGMVVPTDRDSTQPKLTAERSIAKEDSAVYTISWKVPGVGFIVLDGPALIALADAVRAHVKAAYAAEALHMAAIEALASAAEVIAYDISTGWPDNPAV